MQNISRVFYFVAFLIAGCNQPDRQRAEISVEVIQAGYAKVYQEKEWQMKAKAMVENQIRSRGVKDPRVLRAMEQTPRHLFVPPGLRMQAYQDRPLPIGEGQTISQPYIVALMTELLELEGDEKVLEIGTGSGYQAAILTQLAKEVYTIEIVEKLAKGSKTLLHQMDYDNVFVKLGDGYQGWPEYAPFDAIILTAAPENIPLRLVEQMKSGGIMVLPVGSHSQELKVVIKQQDGSIRERTEALVRFVPMIHPAEHADDKDP